MTLDSSTLISKCPSCGGPNGPDCPECGKVPAGAKFEATATGFTARLPVTVLSLTLMLAIEAAWVVGSGYWMLHQPIISPEQAVRSVLLPLVIGSFLIGFLYLVYARSVLTLKRDADKGSVFTGFLVFGKKQEFRWSGVKSVELRDHNIVLMTDTTIQFGAAMRDDHRQYLLRLIQAQLADATF